MAMCSLAHHMAATTKGCPGHLLGTSSQNSTSTAHLHGTTGISNSISRILPSLDRDHTFQLPPAYTRTSLYSFQPQPQLVTLHLTSTEAGMGHQQNQFSDLSVSNKGQALLHQTSAGEKVSLTFKAPPYSTGLDCASDLPAVLTDF